MVWPAKKRGQAMTLATLIGAVLGTALFNGLALLVTKSWPLSPGKILLVGAGMFLLLALGDHAVRETEPLSETFLRVGIAQIFVTVVLLVALLGRKKPIH
jgi:hypothetical protein